MGKQNFTKIAELIDHLPIRSYAKNGQPMEPISLIIIGSKNSIRRLFRANGWYQADSLGLVSLIKTVKAVFLGSSYHRGLMNPSLVNNNNFQLAYERPTRSDNFRRRHHIRLWRISLKLRNSGVWVGTVSYDRSLGLSSSAIPTHHISPSMANEDEYLARSLGVFKPAYIRLSKPEKGTINTGDSYIWNGKALVIDLANET